MKGETGWPSAALLLLLLWPGTTKIATIWLLLSVDFAIVWLHVVVVAIFALWPRFCIYCIGTRRLNWLHWLGERITKVYGIADKLLEQNDIVVKQAL